MKNSIKIFCTFILFSFSVVVNANTSQYIDLETNQYGAKMKNTSNQTLEVKYCINDYGVFSCAKQSLGEKTLRSGAPEVIPGARGKQVYWAACIYPKIPSGWNGSYSGRGVNCR